MACTPRGRCPVIGLHEWTLVESSDGSPLGFFPGPSLAEAWLDDVTRGHGREHYHLRQCDIIYVLI